MILSYLVDPFSGSTKRKRVTARFTTEHSASSYGQPVLVLADGEALDSLSWVACKYQVIKATEQELEALARMGLS